MREFLLEDRIFSLDNEEITRHDKQSLEVRNFVNGIQNKVV